MIETIFLALVAAFRSRQQLALENLAPRHQLGVLHRAARRQTLRTAEWTSLQVVEAFPFDMEPRYVIRDRDSIHGEKVVVTL